MSDEENHPEPEHKDQEEDDEQGFYDAKEESQKEEQVAQNQSKKEKKSKQIKKRKKREPSKKDSHDKRRNEYLNVANETSKKIIQEMKKCYENDLRLYEAKKKASCKLRYSSQVQKLLRNVYVCEKFLDNGGLQCFQQWIRKLPDGTDSSLTLKKKVFNILLTLNVNDEHLERASELKKLVYKNKKNPFVKDLCESIINRWGGNFY